MIQLRVCHVSPSLRVPKPCYKLPLCFRPRRRAGSHNHIFRYAVLPESLLHAYLTCEVTSDRCHWPGASQRASPRLHCRVSISYQQSSAEEFYNNTLPSPRAVTTKPAATSSPSVVDSGDKEDQVRLVT